MITIRGHHLFDMLGALATGESTHKTLGPVARQVRAAPRTPIRLVIGVDDICAPCEWWDHAAGHCRRSLKEHPEDNRNSLTSDANAIAALGLEPGATLPANELYQRIQARVDETVFAERVCLACRLVASCRKTYTQRIVDTVKALSGAAAS